MRIHLRDVTHSEVVNIFQCSDCNIGFSNNRDLKLHRRTDHNEPIDKPTLNACDICDMTFIYVSDLRNHITTYHKSTVDETIM